MADVPLDHLQREPETLTTKQAMNQKQTKKQEHGKAFTLLHAHTHTHTLG